MPRDELRPEPVLTTKWELVTGASQPVDGLELQHQRTDLVRLSDALDFLSLIALPASFVSPALRQRGPAVWPPSSTTSQIPTA